MATKYTDEQIIDYLRTLREGDVLTAVKSDEDEVYVKGESCAVKSYKDGNLYVANSDDNGHFINFGDNYNAGIFDYFRIGIFAIPSQAKPFYIDIIQTVDSGGNSHRVTIDADFEGLAKLRALETESGKASKLSELYAQRDGIQAKIDELEVI